MIDISEDVFKEEGAFQKAHVEKSEGDQELNLMFCTYDDTVLTLHHAPTTAEKIRLELITGDSEDLCSFL